MTKLENVKSLRLGDKVYAIGWNEYTGKDNKVRRSVRLQEAKLLPAESGEGFELHTIFDAARIDAQPDEWHRLLAAVTEVAGAKGQKRVV